MNDLTYIAIVIAAFLISELYAHACEKL